ncbi:hypothetical protein G9A89_010954 [Geosiphon pyriformis]|nr:hypothetical protein G9A89_010954 [Geosiphon pyriformis]
MSLPMTLLSKTSTETEERIFPFTTMSINDENDSNSTSTTWEQESNDSRENYRKLLKQNSFEPSMGTRHYNPLPPPILKRTNFGKVRWMILLIANCFVLLGSFVLCFHYFKDQLKYEFELKIVITFIVTELIFRSYLVLQVSLWSNHVISKYRTFEIILGRQDYTLFNYNLFILSGDSTVFIYMFLTIISDALFGGYYCFLVYATATFYSSQLFSFSTFLLMTTIAANTVLVGIFWRWSFAGQERLSYFGR